MVECKRTLLAYVASMFAAELVGAIFLAKSQLLRPTAGCSDGTVRMFAFLALCAALVVNGTKLHKIFKGDCESETAVTPQTRWTKQLTHVWLPVIYLICGSLLIVMSESKTNDEFDPKTCNENGCQLVCTDEEKARFQMGGVVLLMIAVFHIVLILVHGFKGNTSLTPTAVHFQTWKSKSLLGGG